MVQCGFLFDIIVVRIDVPAKQIEEHKLLSVDAAFNNVTLGITPSRINVVEFVPKRSYDFISTIEDLKRSLADCPLRLQVYYNAEQIGSAEVPWNDCFLDRINSNMTEINHIDETDLFDNNERVGTIEYICRLQCKCEEPSDDLCVGRNIRKDLKCQINKIIDPNDVLFVVADPNKEDVCNVPDHDMLDNSYEIPKPPTSLDLSPYRSLNGRLVQNAETLKTCQNIDCCELVKTSAQYQQILDAFNGCPKKESKRMCQAYEHVDECPHSNKFSSHTDSTSLLSIPLCDIGNIPNISKSPRNCKGPTVNMCGLNIPPPETNVDFYKRPRNCPVCKEDVKWLPKLAACPKCGYKPLPVFTEEPHNENITAEQVLKEYLNNANSDSENEFVPKDNCRRTECRCTCGEDKTAVCANCRVRQLCSDILEPVYGEQESCNECEDDADEQYKLCTSSSKDCRPHLARVFSELKDLFEAATPKPDLQPVNEKCEKQLNPNRKSENITERISTRISTPRRSSGANPVTNNLNQLPKSAYMKKRKRFRKKRSNNAMSRALCRPIQCEPSTNLVRANDLLLNYHNACIDHRRNVPGNMGWLWNANPDLGPRWRPGAIRRPVKEIMRYFLRDFPADTIPISRYSYRRNHGKSDRIEEQEDLMQHPTLHICKKNGEIFITLRPLKGAEALQRCANPYLDMKPIVFKIIKNPLAAEVGKMKQCLRDMGFSKCTCNKPIVECFCRSFLDKKRLEYQMQKECKKRGLDDFYDTLRLSDSEDSEVEYDFSVTPPAGLIKPHLLKRADKVNVGTQYEQCDWMPPPMFPQPPNPYMKWINCATGHKYAYRRASDLLTIGQKEAIICRQKKAEEAALAKANRFKKGKKGGKGKGKAGAGAEAAAAPAKLSKADVEQTCPDGTKVNMRKYLEAENKKKKKK